MDMKDFIDTKPTVGQKVYVARYSQAKRAYNTGEESVVTKVGRKYFEVEGATVNFLNDGKTANSQYSGAPRLYPSKECFEHESWMTKAKFVIRTNMNDRNLENLDEADLKVIIDILRTKCGLKFD